MESIIADTLVITDGDLAEVSASTEDFNISRRKPL
jgi:hypothetical protein